MLGHQIRFKVKTKVFFKIIFIIVRDIELYIIFVITLNEMK